MKISSSETVRHHEVLYFVEHYGKPSFEEKIKDNLLSGLSREILDSEKVSLTEMSSRHISASKYLAEVHVHSVDEINKMMSLAGKLEAFLLKNVPPGNHGDMGRVIANLKNLIKP